MRFRLRSALALLISQSAYSETANPEWHPGGALLLVAVGIGFMIAEIFLPSFGILGIAGFVGFLAGSVILIDAGRELGYAVSWMTIAPAALVWFSFMAFSSFLVLRHQRTRVKSGTEGLLGKTVEALEDFQANAGQVRLDGEIWNARNARNSFIRRGDQLTIVSIDGLTLVVVSPQ